MKRLFSPLVSVCWNLLLLVIVYQCCRLSFYLVNRPLFQDLDLAGFWNLASGGFRFDISSLLYTNSVYVILMLLPFPFRERAGFQRALKILFLLTNLLWFYVDLGDSVYFAFTNRRSSLSVFQEMGGDSQVNGIIWQETVRHWYLVLEGALFFALLYFAYKPLRGSGEGYARKDYALHTLILVAVLYPYLAGLRGGWGTDTHPISPNDAFLYTAKPLEAGLVLNTSFNVYHTLDVKTFTDPQWFSEEVLDSLYTPVQIPSDGSGVNRKNVVIFIMEGFSTAYSQYLSGLQSLEQPYPESYTPFLDSLMQQSLIFRYSFANGRKSIEAPPSVFCSIPSMIESFTLSPYSQNDVVGLAEELSAEGYETAFFHGAQRSSLGLAGFAQHSGFRRTVSREDYPNPKDFDGTWGIWDMQFLQFFNQRISQMKEPFLSAVFTLSSHHPFIVPEGTEALYPEGSVPIYRTIRYADDALRHFFASASKEPWFRNTVFVITGDHTSLTDRPGYLTDLGRYLVPIVFYTPDGSLQGLSESIAQQIDIKPTLLSYLGYSKPTLAFGKDLLSTPAEESYAINYNGYFQFIQGEYLYQMTLERPVALYHFTEDPLLEKNLLGGAEGAAASEMEQKAKAVVQSYISRMRENRISPLN